MTNPNLSRARPLIPRGILLFDIDGTLISTLRAGIAAMDLALREEFGLDTPIEELQIAGRTDRAIAHMQFARHGLTASDATWRRFEAAYLQRLPASLAERKGRVLPGIVALLQRLQTETDLAVGLLTGNMAGGARLKLTHYGIAEHFAFGAFGDLRLTRDEVAQDALDLVRREINPQVDPRQIVILGDTPLDVSCARFIGAQAVAVATGMHSLDDLRSTQPDLLVADLSDPAPLMALLSGLA